MAKARKRPGDDQPVARGAELSVLEAIKAYRLEAKRARQPRLDKSKKNWDLYLGIQDFSYKADGQSREFIPKTGEACEQFSAFIERALTKFQDWWHLEAPPDIPVEARSLKLLLNYFLERLPVALSNTRCTGFPAVASDLVKIGLLRSLMACKIHGTSLTRKKAVVESGKYRFDEQGMIQLVPPTVQMVDTPEWRLAIDLVPDEDYLPDPTGAGLYKIHEVERDFYHLQMMADQGIYDPAVVAKIDEDFHRVEEDEQKKRRNEDQATPGFRRRVVISELWGCLLGRDGRIAERNIVTAMANDKWLIRPPEPNPFWHGEDPFEDGPLIRVPGTVWHKALYDDAGPLNEAFNELFNLCLDGGIGSVWGVRQVRSDWVEDVADIQGDISQSATIEVNSQCPPGGKVVEQVSTGTVPPEAMGLLSLVEREFNGAAFTNEIKLGNVPTQKTTATATMEASQSQAVTLDSIVADIEDFFSRVITKSWRTILQDCGDLSTVEVLRWMSLKDGMIFMRLKPEERYALLGEPGDFKVVGISGSLAKARDFQRLMGLLQTVQSSPLLLQAAIKRYDPMKLLAMAERQLDISPSMVQRDVDAQRTLPTDEAQILALFQQMMGGGGQNGFNSARQDNAGQATLQSEIGQNATPGEIR